MSKYTTGEIAKLCSITVRTVQFYDNKGVLSPSELSEGGRRLYSDSDLKKMQVICFLRELDIPIASIKKLFEEENPEKVIALLIEEHHKELSREIAQKKEQLSRLEALKDGLKDIENFSVESIGDIAHTMNNKKKLTKMRWLMVLTGIPVTALQWVSIILWIVKGIWWLFPVWVVSAVVFGVTVSKYYFDHTAYICPECHEVFKPKFKEAFWAYHTPTMRRLTCTKCGHKGMCVEVYSEKK